MVESREQVQENNMLDNEKLKKTVFRILGNKRNKYIFYEQQEDVIKLINFVNNIQYENTKVPYNILIITDNTEKSEEFCENIDLVAEELNVFEKQMVSCSIKDWYSLKKSFKDMERFYSCLVIKDVKEADLTDENWERLVEMMRMDNTPSLIKIMSMTESAAKLLKENYEDIYYRYFANDYHIVMNEHEVESSIIYQEFFHRLESEGYQVQQEFETGMKDYIKTVYKKAVEREMAFVNDLYNRVVRSALSREMISKQIDKECIPFYVKNEIKEEKKEYPLSRKISRNDKKEENVLFFYLSVLGRSIMSKYQGRCGEKVVNYTGISQLEAGTKHTLYNLALEGKKLDRIVIVESQKTRLDDRKEFAETFWDNPEEMKKYKTSSICFYKQRIKDYLRRKESKEIFKNIEGTFYEENKEFEMPFVDTIEYAEEEIETLFYDIPTYTAGEKEDKSDEENDIEYYEDQSLELFAEIIKGIQGVDNKPVNLYVDMQGGFRSAVSQVDAVLELLKDRNVDIKGRYAINGFSGDGKAIYNVRSVDGEYKAYELVSAMTEFKRYGRGEGLTEFFKKDNEPETLQITGVIRKISDAIALCNVEEFQKQINKLKEINAKPEIKKQLEQKNSQISIVFQDIIEDYKSLLRKESTTFDIVKWCVKKSFYQQAITLIESLMPKMLVECGFLHYDPNDYIQVKDSKTGKNEEVKISDVCEQIREEKHQLWKDNMNYLFERWMACNYKNKAYFGVSELEIAGIDKNSDFKKKANQFQRCKIVKSNGFAYAEYTKNLKEDMDSKLFYMFAALSRILKEVRNKINHAASGESYEKVRGMLETYLSLGEYLKLNEKWAENHKNTGEKRQVKTVKKISSPENVKKIEKLTPGKIVQFKIKERGGNTKRNLRGEVNGIYKGIIEKNYLKDFSNNELDEMCGKTVEAQIVRINGEVYILSYKPETSFGASLKDILPKL